MQLFVKTVTGQTIVLQVDPYARIAEVKKQLHERLGLHPSAQTLIHTGRVLIDDRTVDDYDIQVEDVCYVVLRGPSKDH